MKINIKERYFIVEKYIDKNFIKIEFSINKKIEKLIVYIILKFVKDILQL